MRSRQSLYLAVACLWAVVATPVLAADVTHERVKDLRYGESLYHYFLGRYPDALITLMVAEAEGGIEGHEDYPQIMEAGLRMAFGMRKTSEQAFDTLLSLDKPAKVRDTANFYLTKLHYLQGDYTAAASKEGSIGASISSELNDELELLRIHLLIKTDRENNNALSQGDTINPLLMPLLDELESSRILALHNLGNAAARNNNNALAQLYYQTAMQAPFPIRSSKQAEYLAVRDKTLTALGYIYLRQERYAEALEVFRAVRTLGAEANQALLGYGWAAARIENYLLALKPWQELRKGSLLDGAVQESLLALPWAYEKLQKPDVALITYRESEALLTEEYNKVEALLGSLNKQQVIAALEPKSKNLENESMVLKSTAETLIASPDTTERKNWLTFGEKSIAKTSSLYLKVLFSRDVFQVDNQLLRDLLELRVGLDEWQRKIIIYNELLLEKQSSRTRYKEALVENDLLARVDELSDRKVKLQDQLNTIKTTYNYLSLANGNIKDLSARVKRSVNTVNVIKKQSDNKIRIPFEAEEKLRFFSGVLMAQAANDFHDNVWKIQKTLIVSERMLAESRITKPRVADILLTNRDINVDLARLAVLSKRTDKQVQHLNLRVAKLSQEITNKIAAQLQTHKLRLQSYLAQTRLSIAQLYDAAYREHLLKAEQGPGTEASL